MFLHQFILLPTHPLLWCTLSFITGIAFHNDWHRLHLLGNWGGSPTVLTALAVICALVSLICLTLFLARAHPLFMVCALLATFFLGSLRTHIHLSNHRARVMILTQGPVDCSARVSAIDHTRSRPFKTRLSISIHSLTIEGKTITIQAKAQVSLIKKPSLKIGDAILIRQLIFKAPAQESYRQYLCKEGYTATAFIPLLSYTLLKRPAFSFARFRASLQKKHLHAFSRKLSQQAAALFFPLFLGAPAPNASPSLRKLHTQWGIVHYLARSGLHVMLLAASWSYLLRFFPLNYFIKQLIVLLLVLLYHLLTFPSISFLRAFITYILYKMCVLQNLSYQPLHILSLTTVGVLMIHPLQLFFLDFQLSFGLTFALAWYNEIKLRRQRLPLISA